MLTELLGPSHDKFLDGRKLWKYIYMKIEKLVEPTLQEEWESDIGKINSWQTVYPYIGFQLAKFAYPKDAWDYLGWLYIQSNFAKRYQLEWEIKAILQGDDSIHAFYGKMTTSWDQLAFMEPQFTSVVDFATFETYC